MDTVIAPPETKAFMPPARTLMGPGPSDVPSRVLEAMARPTIGHLDPAFTDMMEDLKRLLRYAFQTENDVTFPVSAPGSVGMELCFVNLVEPGDEVVVCRNGVFGDRLIKNVERCGGTPVVVDDEWGDPVTPEKLDRALQSTPSAKLVAFVHAETSTGAQSDVECLVEIAHAHDCLVIVDAVTALGGCPLKVDEWDIDVVYAGSQKCLSCPPGLAPVTLNGRAVRRIEARRAPCQSWFMDLQLQLGYWRSGARTYHHTAPVNALYGLHEALCILAEEGLEDAWLRHGRNQRALVAGLVELGLHLPVAVSARLPQLTVVTVPDGVDDAAVRGRLLSEHGLEIGAGLGDLAGRVWRIGMMGHSSRPDNVSRCLTALESVLSSDGSATISGAAQAAAEEVFRSES